MIFGHNRNDKGYSLVELIAVITIMTVVVGVAGLSVTLMFSQDAQKAAKLIDDELAETRMLSMSKSGAVSMVLHTDGSTEPTNNSIEIIRGGSTYKNVNIDRIVSITVKGPTGESSPGDDVEIVFDKSNGSVVSVDGDPVPANAVYEIIAASKRGSAKTVTVTLVGNTGRHYIVK